MSFFNTVVLTANAGARPTAPELPPMPQVNFDMAGMSQFSEIVGMLISWIMFIIPLVAAVVILLGVLYIVAPPLRNILDGGRGRFREANGEGQTQEGMEQGGMDGQQGMQQMGGPQMGGMGMGMGQGMGMGHGQMSRNRGMGLGNQRQPQGMMPGQQRFGMSFVLPIAITVGLRQEGAWIGVKTYVKETVILMAFVGIMLAITSLGTVFGMSFNIGILFMSWISNAADNLPDSLGGFEDAGGY